uniref:Ig-like domain-containing protein n=1 Tax=Ditylenchus dipsaci TaxID=166011 RepID=A0A915DS56_9BILA
MPAPPSCNPNSFLSLLMPLTTMTSRERAIWWCSVVEVLVVHNPKFTSCDVVWFSLLLPLVPSNRLMSSSEARRGQQETKTVISAGHPPKFGEGGEDSANQPFAHLLPYSIGSTTHITRPLGGEVRLKCEAASSLPIQFTWLKNLAPIEKNRKTKVRHKEYWSKLVITDLDVLDSGYYQCTAANSAGSVNTTSVLRVNPSAQSNNGANEDYDSYDVNNYLETGGEMRPDDDFPLNVPNSAAGAGYVASTPIGGWM